MDEADEIKQRKLEEMKARYMGQRAVEEKEIAAEQQIDAIMKRVLTQEAKARLSNVRLANRGMYVKAVQAIVHLARQGQFSGKIDDENLRMILEKLNVKRETKIRRV